MQESVRGAVPVRVVPPACVEVHEVADGAWKCGSVCVGSTAALRRGAPSTSYIVPVGSVWVRRDETRRVGA